MEPQESDWPHTICPNCESTMDWSSIEPEDVERDFECPGCGVRMEIGLTFRTRIIEGLSFDDALRIARGCFDYGGGYKDDGDRDIYHRGIQTVVNALTKAKEEKPWSLQTKVLLEIGGDHA